MNRYYLIIVLCFVLAACHTEYNLEKRNRVFLEKRNFILSDTAIKAKPAFITLPAGDVRPKGWLKDWAVLAANGITGHLDEWSATYEKAWKGVGFEARGADAETGLGWPLEQCAYWFDGAVRLAYILDDSALIRKVSARLDNVVNGVLDGNGKGKSFIWWHDVDFRKHEFENWAHSHIGRALVAYYEATGNPRILNAMTKVYSRFEATPVPAVSHNSVSGCCNADPMLDAYMLSGNHQTLNAVLKAANDPKTLDAVQKWNNNDFANTQHGVIVYENLRIPAMIYPYTNRPEFLDASNKYIRWMEKYHGLPFGIASSEEFVAGVGSTRCTETCNVAASAWTFQQMYEITGDGAWGDRLEKVFFNAAPVPVARDYQTMAYYQSPNRIENVFPSATPENPGPGCFTFLPVGHSVLCCVGNLTRVVPNFIMHAWMGTIDSGLAAALYCPSEVNTVVGKGVPVKIVTGTEYPFEETVQMSVEIADASVFPLYLRIPEWCRNPEIKVNGEKINSAAQHGFLRINRKWQTGDRIELHFPMQVEFADGRETPYPRANYFYSERDKGRPISNKPDINSPFRTVSYGPLLFALPIKDIDPNHQAENQQWNYALSSRNASAVTVTRSKMPATWSWRIEDAPIHLTVKAQTFDWRPSDVLPLPETPVTGNGDANITLVPYGCTKFRISMFPITE
ncbi:MAG: glycoside hydrolase family 127 protein [Prevotellaceae bacterium]|jgi:hypothetical protein|nr:glycoside hydrolase family 127 protein [Prevotellaceae bacterium]